MHAARASAGAERPTIVFALVNKVTTYDQEVFNEQI